MIFQVVWTCKTFIAYIADERPVGRVVSLLVPPDIKLAGENSRTLVTRVGFLSGVGQLVASERCRKGKGLAADLAHVGFDPSVAKHVLPKVALVVEAFPTNVAHHQLRPSVGQDVAF